MNSICFIVGERGINKLIEDEIKMSKPKILLVHALKAEMTKIHNDSFRFETLICGVGKVNSSLNLLQYLYDYEPDLVINIGTSGSVKHKVGSIHWCNEFVDRDMEIVKEFGAPHRLNFSSEISDIEWLNVPSRTAVCNTGDQFLTDVDIQADVFDMEGFALALACKKYGVPMFSVKYVTDIIGQNSIAAWEVKLEEARNGLTKYMEDLFNTMKS
ncbi:hypothetical protein K5X82_08720 [Halosquirtibacter xylanolyticus]|uniref:phosphorylase family protein n=1 Tax=Halosquirtibacter xylanolyticus TaxID=3374599 RepID=UPI003747DA0E|nr:hypothetical protein K5X82_08720 [Prolixibacteraceae bacterium]